MSDVTSIQGWRIGTTVLVVSFALFFGGLWVAASRGDWSALRVNSIAAAFFGVLIGARLITPSRHDVE